MASPRPFQSSPAVLVVDDDGMMRSLLTRILQAEGWAVHTAADGVEALSMMDGAAATVNVVVSDVMMPNLNGRQLAVELAKRFPRLPVLLISGAHLGGGTVAVPFLPKPFTPMSLVASIRELLAVADKVS